MDRDPILFDFEEVSPNWRWFLFLSISLIMSGVAGLVALWFSKPVSVATVGALLTAGGIMEVFAAKWGRHSSGLFLRVLVGTLHVFVGVLFISYPGASLAALTMLLAWLFMTSGLVRTAVGGILRYPAWGWAILESVAAVMLAAAIWSKWSDSSLEVVGASAGAALIIRGWAWGMFALGIRPVAVEDTFLDYARNFW